MRVWDNTVNTQLASYSYSKRYNRTAQTVGGVTTNYQYGPTGPAFLLLTTTDSSGTLTAGFVYDANDNLIEKCEGGTVTRTDTAYVRR